MENNREDTKMAIYITYLDHLRDNEAHVLQYQAALIAAVAAFIYAVINKTPEANSYLLPACVFGTALLLIAMLYTFAMSYTHRYLQIHMIELEIQLNLPVHELWDHKGKIDYGSKDGKLFYIFMLDIATSLYKSHILGQMMAVTLIWYFYCGVVKNCNQFCQCCSYGLITFIISCLLAFGLTYWYRRKLRKMFRVIKPEQSRKPLKGSK